MVWTELFIHDGGGSSGFFDFLEMKKALSCGVDENQKWKQKKLSLSCGVSVYHKWVIMAIMA